MATLDLEMYFPPARERYKIFLKKKVNEPKPWTDDPVFQDYRFCNVHRENDKVTAWLRDNYRNKPGASVAGVATFRFINRIETAEKMLNLGLFHEWNPNLFRQEFAGMKPLVGPAYIIKTPNGKNKLEGIIEIVDPIWEAQRNGDEIVKDTLEKTFNYIRQFPFVGPFMAYQIVADLQNTPFLQNAPDIMTWSVGGPGSSKGLATVLHQPATYFNYNSAVDQKRMVGYMQQLLEASKDGQWWPEYYEPFDMQTIQNWLCETFKYHKAKQGSRLKQRYPGI